jgi:hypothetical protein
MEITMRDDGNTPVSITSGRSSHLLKMMSIMAIITPLCLILCLSTGLVASAHTSSASDTVTSTLNGTATGWSSSTLFPGPTSSAVAITMNIDNTTGALTYHFPAAKLTNPSTGVTITITTAPGTATTGTYNAATGALTLNGTLQLQNVPIFGTINLQPGTLSTENSLKAADGTQLTGQRVDANGHATLVGGSSFTEDDITTNLQIRIIGVLK